MELEWNQANDPVKQNRSALETNPGEDNPPVMIVVCCACHKRIGQMSCNRELAGGLSHGYCTACFDAAMREVKEYWQAHHLPPSAC